MTKLKINKLRRLLRENGITDEIAESVFYAKTTMSEFWLARCDNESESFFREYLIFEHSECRPSNVTYYDDDYGVAVRTLKRAICDAIDYELEPILEIDIPAP